MPCISIQLFVDTKSSFAKGYMTSMICVIVFIAKVPFGHLFLFSLYNWCNICLWILFVRSWKQGKCKPYKSIENILLTIHQLSTILCSGNLIENKKTLNLSSEQLIPSFQKKDQEAYNVNGREINTGMLLSLSFTPFSCKYK